jgi:hypothetical protein
LQGKSCFSFTTVDEALFEELAAITSAGLGPYLVRVTENRQGAGSSGITPTEAMVPPPRSGTSAGTVSRVRHDPPFSHESD